MLHVNMKTLQNNCSIRDAGECFTVTPETGRDMRRLPLTGGAPEQSRIKSSWLQVAAEQIVSIGKAHKDEASRQCAVALSMRWRWWGGGLPPLSSARLYYLGSSKNGKNGRRVRWRWRMAGDWSGKWRGRKPRPRASVQEKKPRGFQCPVCCRAPPSSAFCPTRMACQAQLFNQLLNTAV